MTRIEIALVITFVLTLIVAMISMHMRLSILERDAIRISAVQQL